MALGIIRVKPLTPKLNAEIDWTMNLAVGHLHQTVLSVTRVDLHTADHGGERFYFHIGGKRKPRIIHVDRRFGGGMAP